MGKLAAPRSFSFPGFRILAGGLLGVGLCGYVWKRIVKSLDDEARLQFLADAPLKSIQDQNKNSFKAGTLWQEKPVLILALRKPWCPNRHDAAAKFSILVKPELDKKGIALYAVTADTWLVSGLNRNLKGDIFLDVEQRFFRAKKKEIETEEEQLFDGLYLIKGGSVLYDHQTEELRGDVNISEILYTISKIKPI